MAATLDIRTLLVTVIITYGVCACAVMVLRWRLPSMPGLGHFFAGSLLTTGAFGIYLINTGPSTVLSAVVANFISVMSTALLLDGVLRFYGRVPKPPIWIFSILLIPLYVYWTYISPSTELRVLAVIVPLAIICVVIAWTAIARSSGDERTLSLLISLGFTALALAFIARIVSMSWNPWAVIMDAGSLSTSATFLLSGFAMVSSTLGLTLVATQRLLQELRTAREEAEAGSRAKSEFLAVMSHEIRTPMNGVLGAASLILESPTEPRIQRYAETIETSGRAMLRIVDDVLDFSKIEAGHLQLESIPFDLEAEVESTANGFQEAAHIGGLDFEVKVEEGLFPNGQRRPVVGDPGRLRQILSNLIHNAIKFTDAGGIEVCLGRDPETLAQPAMASILIEVKDTGPGISPQLREQLFHPFKQEDASTTRRFGGTGLGLAISHDLALRMGGEVGARDRSSGDSKGSIFWLRLHLPLAPKTEEVPALVAPGRLSDEPKQESARILVAEDNSINQFIMTEILETLGHRVLLAEDGQEAVDAFASGTFDLIFMDCQMPTVDGFEAARQIRAREGGSDLPIIAVTATILEEELQKCYSAGMNAVLTKPVVARDLHEILEIWWGETAKDANRAAG